MPLWKQQMNPQLTALTEQLFSQEQKSLPVVLEIEQWREVPQRSAAKRVSPVPGYIRPAFWRSSDATVYVGLNTPFLYPTKGFS